MVNSETKIVLEVLHKVTSILSDLQVRQSVSVTTASRASVGAVLDVLRSDFLHDIHGYFQNHRPTSAYANIDNEYKVQDLCYCLLRPLLSDLQYENPQRKPTGALTFAQVDFSSDHLKMLLEVKFVDSKEKAKRVEGEISEDITKYGRSRTFDYLIFYIHCSGYSYPNKSEFERGFSDRYSIEKNTFETICIVN